MAVVVFHACEECVGAEGRTPPKTLWPPEPLVAAALPLCQPKVLARWNRAMGLICVDGAAEIRP